IAVTGGSATSGTITGVLVGNVTVTASSAALTTAATSFNVVPGQIGRASCRERVTTAVASGSTRTFTARIRDAAGNTVSGYGSSSTSWSIVGCSSVVWLPDPKAVVGGKATRATITGVLVGNVTVTASSAALTTASTSFNVVPG